MAKKVTLVVTRWRCKAWEAVTGGETTKNTPELEMGQNREPTKPEIQREAERRFDVSLELLSMDVRL